MVCLSIFYCVEGGTWNDQKGRAMGAVQTVGLSNITRECANKINTRGTAIAQCNIIEDFLY